jgi:pimeloyl-ACP methyl ester carboxylesterase
MPLAVITHGGEHYPPGTLDDAQERLWQQLQDELAAMQPGSTHVIATRSGHDIQREQPELVLVQVTRVVAAARVS